MSLITHSHVVPNLKNETQIKTFLDEFRELSDPPIDSKNPYTIKAQKCSKEIIMQSVCNICTRIRWLRSDQSVTNVNSISAYSAADTEQHILFTYVILSKMAL